MSKTIVAFGEVLLRLSPPGFQRITQAQTFEFMFSGAEANVLSSLAQFGLSTRMITRLPSHPVGDTCVRQLLSYGLDVSHILRGGSRVGIYFLETGGSQRGSAVIYDRNPSSMSEIDPASLDWSSYFNGARWFHITGVTPALSESAARANLEGAKAAKAAGLTVSCDLNFRAKLWDKETAKRVMTELVQYVDVAVGLDPLVEVQRDDDDEKNRDNVVAAARELSERYGFKVVGISLRKEYSASRNGWQGLCYTNGQPYWSKNYDIDILERIGTGDAFTAGILYGQLEGLTPQETIEFATASSCLKHTIIGDLNFVTKDEVFNLMKGDGRGRIQR